MHLIFLKAQYICNFLQLVRPSSILFPSVVVLVVPNLFHKGWFSSLFYLLLLPFLFNVCLLFPFYSFLLVWLIDCLVYALLRVSYCPYYPLLFMSQCPFSSWFKYRLLSVVELTFCFLGGFIFMTKWSAAFVPLLSHLCDLASWLVLLSRSLLTSCSSRWKTWCKQSRLLSGRWLKDPGVLSFLFLSKLFYQTLPPAPWCLIFSIFVKIVLSNPPSPPASLSLSYGEIGYFL